MALAIGITGGIGSGKSTIVLNMLNLSHKKDGFRQRFQKIYMISPTASQDDKFSKLIGEVEKDGNLFEDTDDDTIEEIMTRVKAHNEEMKEEGKEGSSLLLIDDCADQFTKRKKSKLNKLVLCKWKKHMSFSTSLGHSLQENDISSTGRGTVATSRTQKIEFFLNLSPHDLFSLLGKSATLAWTID